MMEQGKPIDSYPDRQALSTSILTFFDRQESLTSYLAHLAAAHCVYPGVLLWEMIVPLPGSEDTELLQEVCHNVVEQA